MVASKAVELFVAIAASAPVILSPAHLTTISIMRILRPSQTPNNTGGVSGGGSFSAYLLLILLPMLIGGALLVKRLLQIEPYSFDRWEAPPISSPRKDMD